MTTYANLRTAKMKGAFVAIFLEHQDFSYINILFVIKFQNELKSEWTIVNFLSNVHKVTYNMDLHEPKMTNGWPQFKEFYNSNVDRAIYFKYVGNSEFLIQFGHICTQTFVIDFLQKYDAQSPLTHSPLVHYEHNLSKYNCEASHLDLPKNFGDYFRQSGFQTVVLHGPKAEVDCKLLIRNSSVKFGSGWKKFCRAHELCKMMDLYFELIMDKSTNHIKVLFTY